MQTLSTPLRFLPNCSRPVHPAFSGSRRNSRKQGEDWRFKKAFKDMHPAQVLGLTRHPFWEPGPRTCAAFSKAQPKGSAVELSGADPYNSLVLPLIKAELHAREYFKAYDNPSPLFPSLIVTLS